MTMYKITRPHPACGGGVPQGRRGDLFHPVKLSVFYAESKLCREGLRQLKILWALIMIPPPAFGHLPRKRGEDAMGMFS